MGFFVWFHRKKNKKKVRLIIVFSPVTFTNISMVKSSIVSIVPMHNYVLYVCGWVLVIYVICSSYMYVRKLTDCPCNSEVWMLNSKTTYYQWDSRESRHDAKRKGSFIRSSYYFNILASARSLTVYKRTPVQNSLSATYSTEIPKSVRFSPVEISRYNPYS